MLLERRAIVAQDLEHPEDRPLAGDAPAHLRVAALQDVDAGSRIGAHVGFGIGAGLDVAQHHQPVPGMDQLRRQAGGEGGARGDGFTFA